MLIVRTNAYVQMLIQQMCLHYYFDVGMNMRKLFLKGFTGN